MLRIDRLHVASLPPLSFTVEAGECLAVEGPSGCGKSRLLRAIADLIPSGGDAFLHGQSRSKIPGPEWRKNVRYFATEPQWWSTTPRHGLPPPSAYNPQRLNYLLFQLALDPRVMDRSIHDLSTGERQRLALVRALLDAPAVMLLDQPTCGLDAAATLRVEAVLQTELTQGHALILVSHDAGQIQRLSHAQLQLAPQTSQRNAVAMGGGR